MLTLAAWALLAVACGDAADSGDADGATTTSTRPTATSETQPVPQAPTTPTAPPAPDPVPMDVTACADPDDESLSTFTGELVVTDRHDGGHPRNIGIAVDPIPGAPLIEGREWIRFNLGPLERDLRDHLGETVTVCGAVRQSYKLDRALFLRSYELDGETVVAHETRAVAADHTVEGEIVVIDRHADGHPAALGVAPDGADVVPLAVTNKSGELTFRLGRRMAVSGELGPDGSLTVASYEDIGSNPLVDAGDGFRLSFLAGAVDTAGAFMGGTEVDTLHAFDGKIFAGTSYRKNTQDSTVDPSPPGGQVLVLDKADGRWRVDLLVPAVGTGARDRIVYLDTVRVVSGPGGAALAEPVEYLAAVSGAGEVHLRPPGDDVEWITTGLREIAVANGEPDDNPSARSLVAHLDSVTGESLILAGVGGRRGSGGGIYRGVFDPDRPGLVAWAPTPEFRIADVGRNPRPMGLTMVGGRVYAMVGNQLLLRTDGPDPAWREVWRDDEPAGLDSIRRATEIAGPDGEPSLLFGIEGVSSRLVRVDPGRDHAATVELRLVDTMPHTLYALVGYNGPRVRTGDPRPVTLIGAYLTRPRTTAEPPPEEHELGDYQDMSDGVFLVRGDDGAYAVNRVHDRTLEVHPPLQGVRAILTESPFPGEEDVVYFGGFDHNNHLFHNTGWIMKAHIDDVTDTLFEVP